ncbi:hypothetical protein [Sphingobium subterraneum]|uniref:DUF11 domain-containing protein n=1 Tax=Sphingobium subterraneum TaxID=627688 RepID=A0A841J306_9SPHN|nr:hypothetical protein [Sphingobium subterraneum]MBB6122681.1 hypothetical protein [Sphingobium subterraneum]
MRIPALAIFTALLPATAQAQPVQWQAQSYVERTVTDVNGNQRRIIKAADRLEPGDRLIFIVRYRNSGSQPVNHFALTNAVSRHVSIDPTVPGMEVSVDGGRSWGTIDRLNVPSGLGGTRPAMAEDVTHVRWLVRAPLRPGDMGQISYRATVR